MKTSSKYLIGYLGNVIRPLVLVLPKMNGYVATFRVKDKFVSFCINDEKLLEKYEAVWTKTDT